MVVGIQLPPAAAVNANVNEYESGHDNLPSIGSANSHFPNRGNREKTKQKQIKRVWPSVWGDLRTNDFKDTQI